MPFVHASCLVIRDQGILILGESGSGKSTLLRLLLARAQLEGVFARLLGDDRVYLDVFNHRLVAKPHTSIEGLLEIRGQGLVSLPFEPACLIHQVITCAKDSPPRLPDAAMQQLKIEGLAMPHLLWHISCDIEGLWQGLNVVYAPRL